MPQKSSGRGKREATIMGGTAVDGASRSTYVAIGMLLAVVAIVLILGRGGDKKSEPAPVYDTEFETAPTTSPASAPATAPEEVGFQVDDSEDQAQDSLKAVAISLQEQLSQKRFWSTVAMDRAQESMIIVSTSSCQDPGFKAVLAGAQSQLLEAGVTKLRCVEKHGALVYEESL
jgi:hypothetical protein